LAKKIETLNSVQLVDTASGAFLINRLLPSLRKALQTKQFTYSNVALEIPSNVIQLRLQMHDECSCEVTLIDGSRQLSEIIVAPFKTANMFERRLQYFSEYAMAFWLRSL
jgi:hypothetical protein